jgi:hypothetical protein
MSKPSSNATAIKEERDKWHATMRGQMSNKLKSMNKTRLSSRVAASARWFDTSSMHKLADGMNALSQSAESLPAGEDKPRGRLEALVNSSMFEFVCAVSILANAAFIGVMQDWCTKAALDIHPGGCRDFLPGVNEILVGLYALEVTLRVTAKRSRYFCGHQWQWNWFDLFFVGWCILEICVEQFVGRGLSFLRVLRTFRLVRILRVLRAWRFFSDLRLMTASMLDSLVSLSWAVFLLLLVQYLFSVCFMHAATCYLEMDNGDEETKEDLEKLYGSLVKTMFTLLLAITNGVDWKNVAEPLGRTSVAYVVMFAFYVLFVLIGVLNVLTSTYVERVHELSRLDREHSTQAELAAREAFVNEMRRIFLEVDKDKDGRITWTDFKDYLESEEAQAYFSTQQLDVSDAAGLFSLLKQEMGDENGAIEVEEFALGCMRLRGQAKSSDVMMLMRDNDKLRQKVKKEIRRLEDRILGNGGTSMRSADFGQVSMQEDIDRTDTHCSRPSRESPDTRGETVAI